MAYVQPILGAYTLPHPSAYVEKTVFRGAVQEMADGSYAFDVVATDAKRVYSLTWTLLNDTDKATLVTAFAALKLSPAFFTPPSGDAITSVTRNGALDATYTAVVTTTGLLWNASIELREV